MNLTPFNALVRKDLILYLANRRALLLNFVMPVALAGFFGYLFAGAGGGGAGGGANPYNSYSHSFGGMAVQFILFMAIDAGIGILLAQKLGLWSRMLAAPISSHTLLLARVVSSAIISFAIIVAIFAVAIPAFGVRIHGSVLGMVGVAACFTLMAASFGLLVAALGKTPEAARSIATFATLIMVMLGGAWMPSQFFPQWLQTLTLFIPTRWVVDGFDAMTWRGLGLETALPAMGVQLGFALAFGSIALWRMRRT
jgi:ABC-2 type transport system permease protein